MSSMSRPKQPLGWDSPCHRLHLNFLRYSCRKLRFVLPFIFLNLFLATDQLLSACWVWTPVTGSKKLSEWFTVWRLKPRALWIRLYAAHSSVWTKELGFTCLWIIGKSIAALRLLTSCKYGLAIVDIEEILLFNVVGLVLHTGFEDACYEHISLLKSGEDNQWIQLRGLFPHRTRFFNILFGWHFASECHKHIVFYFKHLRGTHTPCLSTWLHLCFSYRMKIPLIVVSIVF